MVHNQNRQGSSSSPRGLVTLSYRGAGLAGGLPALQLESRDDPLLDGAVASRAHINHHTLPRLEPEESQASQHPNP